MRDIEIYDLSRSSVSNNNTMASSSDDKDKITDETHKKQRVKARWALLFKALDGSASTDDGDNYGGDDSYSVWKATIVNPTFKG